MYFTRHSILTILYNILFMVPHLSLGKQFYIYRIHIHIHIHKYVYIYYICIYVYACVHITFYVSIRTIKISIEIDTWVYT